MINDITQSDFKRNIPFNILVVEDNATDVLLIQSHIEKSADFSLTVAVELSEAMDCLDSCSFDLILLDLNLPDAIGLEGLVKVRRHAKQIPIVVLTGLDDEELGIMALQRGAQDYLIKGVDNTRLVRSIRYAIERMLVYGSDGGLDSLAHLGVKIIQGRSNPSSTIESDRTVNKQEVLTERELQVLKLLGKGFNNQEIAQCLLVSQATVKTHIGHIFKKLSVSERVKAAVEAQRRGLI